MGRVYKARSIPGSDVHCRGQGDPQGEAHTRRGRGGGFGQEIEALAKMARHPNVVEVFDADLSGRHTHYYAMELDRRDRP
jgi:hypothetical protein